MPKAIATGKTFPIKDQLKSLGWRWSPEHKAWTHANWTGTQTWPGVDIIVEEPPPVVDREEELTKEIKGYEEALWSLNKYATGPRSTAGWYREKLANLRIELGALKSEKARKLREAEGQ